MSIRIGIVVALGLLAGVATAQGTSQGGGGKYRSATAGIESHGRGQEGRGRFLICQNAGDRGGKTRHGGHAGNGPSFGYEGHGRSTARGVEGHGRLGSENSGGRRALASIINERSKGKDVGNGRCLIAQGGHEVGNGFHEKGNGGNDSGYGRHHEGNGRWSKRLYIV